MPRLIYFRQSDEDQLAVPPVPLPIDDDSDHWWAGVQRSFVAIPIAATIAAVAFSASLAFGYQQQTEDIVPQPPKIAAEDYWQVRTPPRPLPKFLYLPDPEELPAGSLFGQPDEDFDWRILWGPPFPQPSVAVRSSIPQWQWDVQEPAGSLFGVPTEDYWQVYTPSPPSSYLRRPYLPDPEQFVPPQIATEDYWQVRTPPRPLPKFTYLPDPEELPAGSLSGQAEEDYWQVRTPPYPPFKFVYLPDPEELALPVPFVEDEYWHVQTPFPPKPYLRLPYIPDPEELTAGSLSGQPDEDFDWRLQWGPPFPRPSVAVWPAIPQWQWDQQEPAGSLFGVLTEDYWQVRTPLYPRPKFTYLPGPDDGDQLIDISAIAVLDLDLPLSDIFDLILTLEETETVT